MEVYEMAENQQRLEQLILELNQYQANVDVLRANVEAVEAQINQITITGVTLDGISKTGEEEQEILIPVGSNSFVIFII